MSFETNAKLWTEEKIKHIDLAVSAWGKTTAGDLGSIGFKGSEKPDYGFGMTGHIQGGTFNCEKDNTPGGGSMRVTYNKGGETANLSINVGQEDATISFTSSNGTVSQIIFDKKDPKVMVSCVKSGSSDMLRGELDLENPGKNPELFTAFYNATEGLFGLSGGVLSPLVFGSRSGINIKQFPFDKAHNPDIFGVLSYPSEFGNNSHEDIDHISQKLKYDLDLMGDSFLPRQMFDGMYGGPRNPKSDLEVVLCATVTCLEGRAELFTGTFPAVKQLYDPRRRELREKIRKQREGRQLGVGGRVPQLNDSFNLSGALFNKRKGNQEGGLHPRRGDSSGLHHEQGASGGHSIPLPPPLPLRPPYGDPYGSRTSISVETPTPPTPPRPGVRSILRGRRGGSPTRPMPKQTPKSPTR